MPVELHVKYDRVADSLYIKFRDDRVADSEEVKPGVIVDYNEKGEVVGVEVLWFSRRSIDFKKLIVEGPESLAAEP